LNSTLNLPHLPDLIEYRCAYLKGCISVSPFRRHTAGRLNCQKTCIKQGCRLVFTPIQNVGRTSPMHVLCWHFSPPPHTHGRSKLASHATAPASVPCRSRPQRGWLRLCYVAPRRPGLQEHDNRPLGRGFGSSTIILYTGATLPPVGGRYSIRLTTLHGTVMICSPSLCDTSSPVGSMMNT
jgi:hypothetical protein